MCGKCARISGMIIIVALQMMVVFGKVEMRGSCAVAVPGSITARTFALPVATTGFSLVTTMAFVLLWILLETVMGGERRKLSCFFYSFCGVRY